MDAELFWLGGISIPFVAYGIAGVWNHWRASRPVDPKAILAERFARGEIGEDDYVRRMSILTYGPPLPSLPDIYPTPQLPAPDDPTRAGQPAD